MISIEHTFITFEKQAVEITLTVLASFQIFFLYSSIIIFCNKTLHFTTL